jgi:adenine-specific DNA-methyltransferase
MAEKNYTHIESITHTKKKRVNIPTEQLRNMVPDDDKSVKKVLYPRDQSLDPQLVWNGKDEQDSKDLEVPTVPIYIQEKIHPHSIIESLRAENSSTDEQPQLFSDFNGIDWEEMVEFYQHEQNWQNRMILGDSLLVMNSLAEKENMKGKVQMVFLDPPYGIKFGSNWQVSTRKRDVTDGKTEDAVRQPEQVKAFRDTWEKGIHSYLPYLRDRLVIARELLTESGSIFVQISDENVHLIRSLLDEVFGSENFIGIIPFRKKTMPLGAKFLESMYDTLVWYGKSKENTKYHALFEKQDVQGDFHWAWYETQEGVRKKMTQAEINNHALLPSGVRIFRLVSMWPASFSSKAVFEVEFNGKKIKPPHGQCWPTNEAGMEKIIRSSRVHIEGSHLRRVVYLDEYSYKKLVSLWSDTVGARDQSYVVETNPKVIERCILMTTDPGDLVLDPTCGSGTTAYTAEQWGRRWITTDTSRVALALARTRLMSSKYPYYLLSDSEEGKRKEMELTKIPLQEETQNDIQKGFVYKRIPKISLKAIANNEEILEIYTSWQTVLASTLAELNETIDETFQDWELPFEADELWNDHTQKLHKSWWDTYLLRLNELNKSIMTSADIEYLYDQPYENNKKLRVSGPFTVESLSPHRIVSTDEEVPTAEVEAQSENPSNFTEMILDNLRKAGVQNTVKGERLKFESLESFAGTWVHAYGEYLENEQTKRVAICVGPQYGTVDADIIRQATIEALDGVGVDLLIVCAFAFEGNSTDTTQSIMKRYGKLTVLLARMNPDLAMGNELLKKTGTGNLFTVFGEPDIAITKESDGKLTAEVKGLDIYDPTTGEIRSSSTDDIACWFIDTNYNGQSFFVRHAYFTGADKPYEKLKKTLRTEIDEDAWESIYSTVSRPFTTPSNGKIAIKIINHYGDEVLKVYDVRTV